MSIHVPPFGLGFRLARGTHDTCFHHSGWNAGFTCDLRGFMGGHEGVVVMTNSDDGFKVIQPLLSAVARAFGWADLLPRTPSAPSSAPQLTSVEGTYEFGAGFTLVVRARERALEVQATGQPPLQFEWAPDGSFCSRQLDTRLAFVMDASGSASVRLTQHEFEVIGRRKD